jgi:hypothetical protein
MKKQNTDNSNRVVSIFEVGECYGTSGTIRVNGVLMPMRIKILKRTSKMLWIQGTAKSDIEVGAPMVHLKKISYTYTSEESEGGLLVSQHEAIDPPKRGGKAWADSRIKATNTETSN